jgi:hypothetical protein
MSIRPHFEQYRFATQICTAKDQTIVECRLAGAEISTVLAVHAQVSPTAAQAADGEIRYEGRLNIHVVYEDADGRICRAERGAEFSHAAKQEEVSPSARVFAAMKAESVSWRREGAGVYVTAIVGVEIDVFEQKRLDYLYDGENLIVNRGSQSVEKTVCLSAFTEHSDEFETDHVGDILMHVERAQVLSATAQVGQVCVEGEICLSILAMKEDGNLCSYERLVPFKVTLDEDESRHKLPVKARVQVQKASLFAQTDEEKGKTKMQLDVELCTHAALYIQEELPVCVDAYSLENEVKILREQQEMQSVLETRAFCERVSGKMSIHEKVDFSTKFLSTLPPRVEISAICGDDGWEMQGAVLVDLICLHENERRVCKLSLPFAFPVAIDGTDVEVSGFVCGFAVRQRQEGELEGECVIKFAVTTKTKTHLRWISSIEEGAPYEKTDCAVSVYFPAAGDGLWETAKKLKVAPDALTKSNPNLQFPLKAGERIFVYRQKTK